MTQIIAYICSKNAGEIDVETPEKDGISESESQVVAYIQPVNPQPACKNGVGLITVYIIESESDEYCNQENNLSWSRVTKDIEGKPTGNVYPVIRFETPPHCHWITSVLKFYGTPDISDLVGKLETSIYPATGDGACSDNKSDVFGGGNTIDHVVNQNRIIPGHRLELEVFFNNGDETIIKKSISKYWCTGSIYGGIVTAVNGDYGDVNITYTVIISGDIIECKSSDFAEYSVGDWVFVGKTACVTEIPETDCTPDDNMVILPLKVNGYGTISRDHEYIEFGLNEVPELFDACVLDGQIIEINNDEDKADVEISGIGRKNNIPIFYHCPFSQKTEGGRTAFKEDDLVSVLTTGMESVVEDYCIVGFQNGLSPCDLSYYIKVTREYDQQIMDDGMTQSDSYGWPMLLKIDQEQNYWWGWDRVQTVTEEYISDPDHPYYQHFKIVVSKDDPDYDDIIKYGCAISFDADRSVMCLYCPDDSRKFIYQINKVYEVNPTPPGVIEAIVPYFYFDYTKTPQPDYIDVCRPGVDLSKVPAGCIVDNDFSSMYFNPSSLFTSTYKEDAIVYLKNYAGQTVRFWGVSLTTGVVGNYNTLTQQSWEESTANIISTIPYYFSIRYTNPVSDFYGKLDCDYYERGVAPDWYKCCDLCEHSLGIDATFVKYTYPADQTYIDPVTYSESKLWEEISGGYTVNTTNMFTQTSFPPSVNVDGGAPKVITSSVVIDSTFDSWICTENYAYYPDGGGDVVGCPYKDNVLDFIARKYSISLGLGGIHYYMDYDWEG